MSGPMELTTDERVSIADAAALSPAEYDRTRTPLAKKLGVRVTALDAEVAGLQRNGNAAHPPAQGTAIAFADPRPWPGRVSGAHLLNDLADVFGRYLALPPHADAALALWTLHAHAHDAAQVSPILAVTSPTKRCGKTTLLHILAALVSRPLHASNVTTAVLFRSIEKYRPTLLIDEADTFLMKNDELRGILNSGHMRGGVVLRTVGDDHEPRAFSTWCPKAVAMIGHLPGTLADRSIGVAMRRRTRGEQVERLRLDRLDALEPLRRRAWTWAQANMEALRAADPDVPETLHDRGQDNWRPLLAIADWAGGEWPERARAAALALSGIPVDDDEPAGVLALHDAAALFKELRAERLASETIVDALVAMEERPWPEWSYSKPLSKRGLARLLRPFGIRPGKLREGKVTFRGYLADDFADALSRYPLPEVEHPEQPPPGQIPLAYVEHPEQSLFHMASGPISHPEHAPPCSTSENGVSARRSAIVPDVPDTRGGIGRERVFDPVPGPGSTCGPPAFPEMPLGPGGLWDEGGRDTIGDEDGDTPSEGEF